MENIQKLKRQEAGPRPDLPELTSSGKKLIGMASSEYRFNPVVPRPRKGSKHPIGEVLLNAARVYDAMSTYRDEKLIRQYLYMNPPLHPRRTLTEVCHPTDMSRGRDRQQIVHKATERPLTRGNFAFQRRRDVRVVMVDQLWMWILDGEAIVTCFPRRYGVGDEDPFGVQESIQARLKKLKHGTIKSVFDLGLIILDEVSNAMFKQPTSPQVCNVVHL
jgi:hypothetical protein